MGDPGGLFGLASAGAGAGGGGDGGGDVSGGGGDAFDPSAGMGGLDPGLGMGMGADTSGFGGGGLDSIAAQVTGPQSSDPTGSLGAQQAIQGGMQGNQPPLTDQPSATPPPSQQPQTLEPQRYRSASEALFKGFQDKEYPGLSSAPGYAEVGQSDVGGGATTGQAAPGGLPKLPPMPPSYSQAAPGGLPKLPPESPQSNVPTPQPRPVIPTPQPRPSPGQDLPVPATADGDGQNIPTPQPRPSPGQDLPAATIAAPSSTPPVTPPGTSPGMGGGAGSPLEQLVGQFVHMLMGGLGGGRGGMGGMLEQMIDRALGINPQRMFPQYYGGGFNPPPPSPGSGYFPPGATGGRPAQAGEAGTGTPPPQRPGPPGSQGNPPSALPPGKERGTYSTAYEGQKGLERAKTNERLAGPPYTGRTPTSPPPWYRSGQNAPEEGYRGGQAEASQHANNFGQPMNRSLATDRQKFATELQQNPTLREKMKAIMYNELGSNPRGTQAIAETAMNRASIRRTPLWQQLGWHGRDPGGYYQVGQGIRGYPPQLSKMLDKSLDNALAGSNISNYATDNSSGGQTRSDLRGGRFISQGNISGETFFRPNVAEPVFAQRWQIWRQMQDAQNAQTAQQ